MPSQDQLGKNAGIKFGELIFDKDVVNERIDR